MVCGQLVFDCTCPEAKYSKLNGKSQKSKPIIVLAIFLKVTYKFPSHLTSSFREQFLIACFKNYPFHLMRSNYPIMRNNCNFT